LDGSESLQTHGGWQALVSFKSWAASGVSQRGTFCGPAFLRAPLRHTVRGCAWVLVGSLTLLGAATCAPVGQESIRSVGASPSLAASSAATSAGARRSPTNIAAEPSASGHVDLQIADGADQGTYSLGGDRLTCLFQDPNWLVRWRDTATAGPSELFVRIDPPADGSPRFTLFVSIGAERDRARHAYLVQVADPERTSGSGTVTVMHTDSKVSVRISAKTRSGTGLALAVECPDIVRRPAQSG